MKTTRSHPKSFAAKGNAETIAVGGVPNRRAPLANIAPFCIPVSRPLYPGKDYVSLLRKKTGSNVL